MSSTSAVYLKTSRDFEVRDVANRHAVRQPGVARQVKSREEALRTERSTISPSELHMICYGSMYTAL